MSRLLLPAFLLLVVCCLSHTTEKEDVHFYCRVCGALITNVTNIIKKDAVNIDFNGDLENQTEGVTIPYDSFSSTVFEPFLS